MEGREESAGVEQHDLSFSVNSHQCSMRFQILNVSVNVEREIRPNMQLALGKDGVVGVVQGKGIARARFEGLTTSSL